MNYNTIVAIIKSEEEFIGEVPDRLVIMFLDHLGCGRISKFFLFRSKFFRKCIQSLSRLAVAATKKSLLKKFAEETKMEL